MHEFVPGGLNGLLVRMESHPNASTQSLRMGPFPTEMIHYYIKEASVFILALRMRHARIAPGAAAVLAKEPGQIRWTILRIATKIIDAVPAEIAEE